ncbi:MAG: sugar phosphate isomerase/epimerase family protein [Planctomycetota bacterium]|jgi:sugar phosphate isomerase/epimerase
MKENTGKSEVGYQSCRYNGLFLEEEIAVCRKDRVKVFDIFFDGFRPLEIDAEARMRIRSEAERSGITLVVDAPMVPFAGPHVSALRDTVDFAKDVGASLLTVHIGHFDSSSDPASELKRCADYGIMVGLENAVQGSSWDRPDTLERMVARCMGAGNLGFTLDIGHANMVGKAREVVPKFLDSCRSLGIPLICVHAHDNTGDADSHLGLGRGAVNFPKVFGQIRDSGFSGPVIIEHWRDLLRDTAIIREHL